MKFHVKPVLEQMAELYRMPRNRERFGRYLFMLQGQTKNDLVLPISGYNPMGQEHVLQKIAALIELKTETLIQEDLSIINEQFKQDLPNKEFEVVINLSDDLGGAWTDRYASDYSSKFEYQAIWRRNFCTPYLWTSEELTPSLIRNRTRAYVYRTIYASLHHLPKTLEACLQQEVFVSKAVPSEEQGKAQNFQKIHAWFRQNRETEDYGMIFNFFYGDPASESLGYRTYGRGEWEGFQWANTLARQ